MTNDLTSKIHGLTPIFHGNWSAIHKKLPNGKRKYKYIINKGSSRSSKTYSLIDCVDIYASRNPYKRITIWRDTKKSCKDTVLKDALKHHKLTGRYNKGYQFNKTESIFNYHNHSTVEICGTDDEEKVHGFTQDVAWLNEPYKISKETFNQIDQRTSDFIFIDYNPKKRHWVDNLSKLDNAIVLHSTYKDNPFCPDEQRKKIESYQPIKHANTVLNRLITEEEAKHYNTEENPLNFTKNDLEELKRCQYNENNHTADEYNWQVYGLGEKAEKPNKIYKGWRVITELEFDKLPATSYFGLDFGETNPTALVECKYHDGTFYFKELIYKAGKEIPSLTEQLETLGIEKGTDIIVCDSASPEKINELRGVGFYAVGANKGQGSVVAGVSFLNKCKAYYTKLSNNLEDEYNDYEWELDRYGLATDKPIKKEDHTMDAIRYITSFLKTYLDIKV